MEAAPFVHKSYNFSCSVFEIINFRCFDDDEGLPFPLHLHPVWKGSIVTGFVVVLVAGTSLRKKIILYLMSPEARLGPINTLIWMDQINGILLAYSIISRIFFIVSSVPFSSILGVPFCTFSRSMAYAYITGSFVWSCFIAIYRVLYIKAHSWVKFSIGEDRLLSLMLGSGCVYVTVATGLGLIFDDDGSVNMLCTHHSTADFDILHDYQEAATSERYNLKRESAMVYAIAGVGFNLVEILSYIILFYHVGQQNERASDILHPAVVKNRKLVNAVSLVGLFAGWIMEIWFIAVIAIWFLVFESNWIRQLTTIFKMFEFYFIPLVQVHTSAPIKRFLAQQPNPRGLVA